MSALPEEKQTVPAKGGDAPPARDDLARIAWLAKAARAGRDDHPRRHLLTLRFALVNLAAFAFLGVLALHGYVRQVFAGDETGLVALIAAVFLGGFGLCAWRVLEVSRETERARSFDPLRASRAADYVAEVRGAETADRSLAASNLRLVLSNRIIGVRHVANALILLGLIGTVIGFIIALSGVDPATVADVSAVSPLVARLVAGMSVALYTTLAGAVLHLWLIVNYQLLVSGTVELIETITRLGERHARA